MKTFQNNFFKLIPLFAIFLVISCCPCDDEMPTPIDCGTEDCINFDPFDIEVVPFTGGQYRIIEGGNHAMFLFPNEAEANMAKDIIQHYGMTESCFVGRPDPSFQYLLVNNDSPVGSFSGEDCVSFNPETTEVDFINGTWKIVDGSHWLFDFGSNEEEAENSLCIIQKYGFTQSCFVGRPDPSLIYLRK